MSSTARNEEFHLRLLPGQDTIESAREVLSEAISELGQKHPGGLLRLEVPVPGIRPLLWLQSMPQGRRLLWLGREGEVSVAGIGHAMSLFSEQGSLNEALERLEKKLEGPRWRFYGGVLFDEASPTSEEWESFGHFRFVCPRIEFGVDRLGGWIACHVGAGVTEAAQALAALRMMVTTEAPKAPEMMAVGTPGTVPSYQGWQRAIQSAHQSMAEQSLRKVVLSRRVLMDVGQPVDPLGLLSSLAEKEPNTYRFFLEFGDRWAFLGASPERLFLFQDGTVTSEALAGTRARGPTEEQDEALKLELLLSSKDRHEQELVTEAIVEVLSPLTKAIQWDPEPSVKPFDRVQHLFTPIHGTVEDSVTSAQLLDALHPTPAVGGLPRAAAVKCLLSLEGYERGLYAAPVGWIGQNSAEFSVAIRSALWLGSALALYSGAGIVPASEARAEWNELDLKLSNMGSALGTDIQLEGAENER